MRRLAWIANLGLAACFCSELVAQDVAITNVRIITVTGPVIESGTIIVRGGKIVSAAAGSANTAGLRVIDGKGMTAMPGYIDAHKHVDKFNKDQAESVLEAGYTTVLSGGGTAEDNLKLAQNIDSGVFKGPHIIPAASLPVVARDFTTVLEKGTLVGLTPEAARAAIREMAAKGIKHTGEIVMAPGRSESRRRCGSQSRRGRRTKGGRADQCTCGLHTGHDRCCECGHHPPGSYAEQRLHGPRRR